MGNSNINRRSFIQSALLAGSGLISPAPSAGPRRVKIATISQMDIQPYVPGEKMISGVMKFMETAAPYKPDIISVPETFSTVGERDKKPMSWRVKTTDSAIERFRKFAADNGCYVVCPGHIKEGSRFYNAAVLIDRKGNIVGNHKKAYPTQNEMSGGVSPGPLVPPVFETDFGKIGFQICFDVLWEDGWRHLKDAGAEIVFWPSAYAGGKTINAKAAKYQYVVVSSTRKHTSKICDISGEEIVKTGFWSPNLAIGTVNLEKALIHTWPAVRKFPDIKAKYLDKIRITNFDEEEWSVIECISPELKIDAIMKEFELLSLYDYVRQSTKAQDLAR